jgi:TonB family protein
VLRGPDYAEPKDTANGTAVGRVGAGNGPPRMLLDPDPEYTEEAKKAKYEGTVVVAGTVDTDGRMKDIQLIRPLGLGLDEKAVAAAQSWKFDPSTHKGKPVPVRIAIEINFHLY